MIRLSYTIPRMTHWRPCVKIDIIGDSFLRNDLERITYYIKRISCFKLKYIKLKFVVSWGFLVSFRDPCNLRDPLRTYYRL